jgi:hypothetical protein
MALLSPTIDAATLEKINASYGADARFVNELESAGFFDELNRQYGK